MISEYLGFILLKEREKVKQNGLLLLLLLINKIKLQV
jgi:hypothetical protein